MHVQDVLYGMVDTVWELKIDLLDLDQMKFPGWNIMENVLEILGMIEDVIRKLDNIIFQDGLRDVLNNIVPLNKQKQDVKELVETVEVLQSIKEDGELELNIDL